MYRMKSIKGSVKREHREYVPQNMPKGTPTMEDIANPQKIIVTLCQRLWWSHGSEGRLGSGDQAAQETRVLVVLAVPAGRGGGRRDLIGQALAIRDLRERGRPVLILRLVLERVRAEEELQQEQLTPIYLTAAVQRALPFCRQTRDSAALETAALPLQRPPRTQQPF